MMLKTGCQLVNIILIYQVEFIIFGLKRQRDQLKALISWVVVSTLLSKSKIWVCGLILIFPCQNMFSMSAKVVLCNTVTSYMSCGFLLMMLLYFWLMHLLVVSWITATHFLGAFPVKYILTIVHPK